MKRLLISVAVLALASSTAAVAKDHDNHGHNKSKHSQDRYANDRHDDHHDNGLHRGWGREYDDNHHWRRGERIGYNNWQNARPVDYRQRHLRAPPRGYEWRQSSNGDLILAAIAGGLIASIIAGNH